MTERDDRAQDVGYVDILRFESLHERAVDLDLVEGEAPQIAQAGIASPEIVHSDRDAQGFERPQLLEDCVRVVEEQAFRDLELEPARVQAAAGQRRFNDAAQVALNELEGR